ncbi:MAG: glycosyltransferase, partial [bacterium]|nr:glycosyltransferase [bacterium]
MESQKTTFVVVPAYHEASVIQAVIAEIRAAGYNHIIIVDDGSQDDTFEKAKATGVITLRHRLNRGKGAATK